MPSGPFCALGRAPGPARAWQERLIRASLAALPRALENWMPTVSSKPGEPHANQTAFVRRDAGGGPGIDRRPVLGPEQHQRVLARRLELHQTAVHQDQRQPIRRYEAGRIGSCKGHLHGVRQLQGRSPLHHGHGHGVQRRPVRQHPEVRLHKHRDDGQGQWRHHRGAITTALRWAWASATSS